MYQFYSTEVNIGACDTKVQTQPSQRIWSVISVCFKFYLKRGRRPYVLKHPFCSPDKINQIACEQLEFFPTYLKIILLHVRLSGFDGIDLCHPHHIRLI
jgi:hypothetical protein